MSLRRVGLLLVAVLLLGVGGLVLFNLSTSRELLYDGSLEGGLRYEVYGVTRPFGSFIPGSSYGGAGLVKVYDAEGEIILRRSIRSTFSEVSLVDGGERIHITMEGTWPLKN